MIPPPSPALVHPDPLPVDLLDGAGRPVGVSGRGELTDQPHRLAAAPSGASGMTGVAGTAGVAGVIAHWAGPWPAEQRWWDPLTSRRRARIQVVLEDGSAHLLVVEQGGWQVEATYD